MGLFEIGIILFLVFLVFGPKRLTNLFSALGRGVKDFTTEFGKDKEEKNLGSGEDEDKSPERRNQD